MGGCVRDMILKREPKDWDVATNAKPEEIQKLFKDSVYENDFGTVLVKTEKEDSERRVPAFAGATGEKANKAVEVTTYRIEGKYSDKRHPDEVKFAKTIEEDLSRRDFTVNAMAMDLKDGAGYRSIRSAGKRFEERIIRTVGNAEERFGEDALRLMRAVRFAVELDFEIDLTRGGRSKKWRADLEEIAKERVRDELRENAHGAERGERDYSCLKSWISCVMFCRNFAKGLASARTSITSIACSSMT